MNKRTVSSKVLLCFLMMMFLMFTVGCSKSDDNPPAAATTYTVTFDSQSATVAANPTSITVPITPPLTTLGTLPTTPTNGTSTFAGWWTGTVGTGTEFTFSTPVTGNITVYAYWTTNTVYTVTFNSQGGTAVGAQHAISGGTVVLPAAPTKTGYLFDSWNTQADGLGATFTGSITGNITVYAKWNSYKYIVTYSNVGGSAVSPQPVISPATNVGALPTTPTNGSSTFAGWNTILDGTGTAFTATTVVTASITVYAQWTTGTVYTVTYDSQYGTAVAPQQVVSGGTVGTLPANPTRSGYTFGGWYTDTSYVTAFTKDTTVTASITVYAKWTAVTGTSTASGTYTWNSGTSTLTFNWTSTNFLCNGPSLLGAETETGVTIGTTTMTWVNSNNNMTWTRSAGTAGDPTGTWTSTDSGDGNTYTIVVTATNSTSGTASVSAPIIACGSGDLNPGVQSHYEPGNTNWVYSVYGQYKDPNHTASAVSVTGSGISGSGTDTLSYNSTDQRWPLSMTLGDTPPTVPLTYNFTITDTSTWTKTVTVHCFMTHAVSNLSPTGTIATATPTFSWTGISDSDASYEVYVEDSSYNRIWDKWSITGTSVPYGGPSLTPGATYHYQVMAFSRSFCLDGDSDVRGSFTYQP